MPKPTRILSPRLSPLLAAALLGCGGTDEPPPAVPAVTSTASAAAPAASAAPAPPETPKRPVVDEYHGTKVTDDYRWLEDGNSAEVKAWGVAENAYARGYLDALPDREALRARVTALLGGSSADRSSLTYRGGLLFALEDRPPKQQSFIVVLKSADDTASERVIVDPNVIDPSGKTSIDFFVPSLDGKLLAVSLSQGGSESGTVHVYDVATGKERGDVIPRVNGGTAGGSLAWNADGSGFYYTRYPRAGERPAVDLDFYQQVYFHKLGTPEKEDKYSLGKELPRIAEIELQTSDDGKFVLAGVANGDGGEFAYYLHGAKGWAKVSDFADKVVKARFGRNGGLYLLSVNGSPRGKILHLPPGKTALSGAKVVVPESDVVIQSFQATKTRLYVSDLVGGPSELRIFDKTGKPLGKVPILPVSAVGELEHESGDDLLFRNASYIDPQAIYRFSAKEGKTKKTGIFLTSPADFSDAEVVRETCASKDGTKVPLNIIRRKGVVKDGKNPTVLGGYGGYGLSRQPRFNPMTRLWLDGGGVYAIANLRGGGEFGEAWHEAGKLAKKQNVFDDFEACARHLVAEKYTSAPRLGIIGGSNGGLLMGAAVTQHPELYGAVVSFVGIYDMLRVESTPNGAFNVTEFGTVKDPALFKALYAYSPYHHVTDGAAYPPILFVTGANDPRVDPYNSRKMTARMQAATGGKSPVLLRASGDTGHGGGTPLSAEIEEDVDAYGFLFHALGVRFPAAPAAK